MKFNEIQPINDIIKFEASLEFDKLEFILEPITLFHYTSGQGLKSIIENKEIWLSKSEFLNDKQEIKYTLELVLKIIDDCMSEEPTLEESVFKEFIKNSLEKKDFIFKTYTLSLSKNEDSNLMWSNYAENDGYNVGFTYPELALTLSRYMEKNPFSLKGTIQPYFIVYDKNRQEELLRKEIINIYKIFLYSYSKNEEMIYYNYRGKPLTNILLYSLFFKAECFRQEEEFRIALIFVEEDNEKIIYDCRLKNGVFIPYIKLPIVNEFDEFSIKSITIGPKNNLDIAEEGLKYFIKLNKLSHIDVKKSKIPYRY